MLTRHGRDVVLPKFTEINIMEEPGRRDEMIRRAGGGRTVPQIFIDGEHIGGSDELAAQIHQGIKPDDYAAANTKLPDDLYARGLVGKPVKFATNRLVIAIPKGAVRGAPVGTFKSVLGCA